MPIVYRVLAVNGDRDAKPVDVIARSPEEAAELVLGERPTRVPANRSKRPAGAGLLETQPVHNDAAL